MIYKNAPLLSCLYALATLHCRRTAVIEYREPSCCHTSNVKVPSWRFSRSPNSSVYSLLQVEFVDFRKRRSIMPFCRSVLCFLNVVRVGMTFSSVRWTPWRSSKLYTLVEERKKSAARRSQRTRPARLAFSSKVFYVALQITLSAPGPTLLQKVLLIALRPALLLMPDFMPGSESRYWGSPPDALF